MALPLAVDHVWRQRDYWVSVYRRTWKGTVVSSFLNPLLYVVSMGVVLGDFVRTDPARLEGAATYLAFIAPGLLAGQCMQIGVGESTYPVLSMIKWQRVYFGMNATPLRPLDLVDGTVAFIVFRIASAAAVFVLVLAPFGVFASVLGAVGACLAAVLTGLALAMPVFAFTTSTASESSFSLILRLGVLPQFLFSGAFFPTGNLSPVLEAIARATPLYQGVDLTRMASLGTWQWGPALIEVAYLLGLLVAGHVVAVRSLARRLAV